MGEFEPKRIGQKSKQDHEENTQAYQPSTQTHLGIEKDIPHTKGP